MKINIGYGEIAREANRIANQFKAKEFLTICHPMIYGVPRGGIAPAFAVAAAFRSMNREAVVTSDVNDADLIVDDLVDSGITMRRYAERHPQIPFYPLFTKTNGPFKGKWLVFPWEVNESGQDGSVEDNVVRLLQYIGDDPAREGLKETPARVAKAWKEWCTGYDQDPADILKVFEDGAENYDQMVTVVDIPIYSKCEHHMADIFGTVTISYLPDKKIVGLSKLSRLADIFARRLQVQERLTAQIADALHTHLKPKGVGVCIKARHMCMESRGVCKQGHHTVTTALRGVMLTEPSARAEFLQLTR